VKKAIIATLASLAIASSTAFAAAPVIDLAAGQGQLGYSYSDLKTSTNTLGSLGNYHANDFQLAYGLTDKLALTGDYLGTQAKNFDVYTNGAYSGSVNNLSYNATELGLQYQLNSNTALLAGNVKTEAKWDTGSNSATETYGGVAFKANITNNLNGYASYLKSTNVQDMKAGVTYNLGRSASLDLGYRSYENTGVGNVKAEGMTVGANYRF
jgi:putative virulence related protein PagC